MPPRCGKNPASSKSSSGSSSNPMSIHPRTKSNYINERSFERTEFELRFLNVRRAENIPFETLIFKYVHFDTMISGKKRGESNALECHTSSIEKESSKTNWKENSAIFVHAENIQREIMIPQRLMN